MQKGGNFKKLKGYNKMNTKDYYKEKAFKNARKELKKDGTIKLDTLLDLFKERWFMEKSKLKDLPMLSKPCTGVIKKNREEFLKHLKGYKMALQDVSSDLGKCVVIK